MYMSLWPGCFLGEGRSETVARTCDPLALAWLAQDDCDVMLVIRPRLKRDMFSLLLGEQLSFSSSATSVWRSQYPHSFCRECPRTSMQEVWRGRGRRGWPPSFSNCSYSQLSVRCAAAARGAYADPICLLTVRMYLKQLGPRSVITRNAYTTSASLPWSQQESRH